MTHLKANEGGGVAYSAGKCLLHCHDEGVDISTKVGEDLEVVSPNQDHAKLCESFIPFEEEARVHTIAREAIVHEELEGDFTPIVSSLLESIEGVVELEDHVLSRRAAKASWHLHVDVFLQIAQREGTRHI
jgi:hypothetical protein